MIDPLIVDTGTGNLFSLARAIERLGCRPRFSRVASEVAHAEVLILPGVASFTGIARGVEPVRSELRARIAAGVPVLGICAGLQILARSSEEGPGPGLGVFDGAVLRLPGPILPHMGWSALRRGADPLLADLGPEGVDPELYFAHSYALPATTPGTMATAHHGVDFAAVLRSGSVVGVQFHPEKSGAVGARFLAAFLRWASERPCS
ncbi:MAG: imidazole glycerol phosphate synthase subunit HisH [Thermoplasmata archaeon]